MSMEFKKIGFIGTGVMGSSMASHLIDARYNLFVYNRTKSKADLLVSKGAIFCNSVEELAKTSDIIFSIVGFPSDVEEVIYNKVLDNAKVGTVVIDMTTSKPKLAKKIYEKAKSKGIFSLDAPVTGGDIGAKNGTLAIFVGGDKNVYEQVLPFFEKMGKNIAYMGNAGNGQHAKMANQISIAAGIIGTCETLIYAKNAGLDLNEVIRMVGSGSAASWQINNMGPRIVKGDFNPGFFIKHFIKDLKIALEECEQMGIKLEGLELAYSLYKKAEESGYENLGTQSLYKLFDEK